jgi:hypothetical protein
VHVLGIVQSVGLFFVVCLASAAMLSLAMVALARMERAAVVVRPPSRRRVRSASTFDADRVSSPGSCTYGPRR